MINEQTLHRDCVRAATFKCQSLGCIHNMKNKSPWPFRSDIMIIPLTEEQINEKFKTKINLAFDKESKIRQDIVSKELAKFDYSEYQKITKERVQNEVAANLIRLKNKEAEVEAQKKKQEKELEELKTQNKIIPGLTENKKKKKKKKKEKEKEKKMKKKIKMKK